MQDCAESGSNGTARKGTMSGEHFVKHCPKREDVRSGVGRSTFGLLWRHVSWGAHNRSHLGNTHRLGYVLGRAAMVALLCESEVEELYLTRGCHQDVCRFQIAMNDV